MKTYVQVDQIFIDANNYNQFGYSDGDETENYILETITRAEDNSVGSEELIAAIKDWPTLYHLHPKRVNLLRPFEQQLKEKKVLEIGCGCGAITRYIGEAGGFVTALEGSMRRAQITAARCHDLSNVKVVCDNFQDFETNEQYDIITLIGVLEYSTIYVKGDDPIQVMLSKVKKYLAPGGMLIIAIENKLGLKYWAGAPEDHTGQPYQGIENRYSASTAVTFGKKELSQELKKNGFSNTTFLYPFPDYKLPDAIVTERGLQKEEFNVPMLLLEDFEYVQSSYYSNHFSTSLVAAELDRNGLLADFSNSFLVVASSTDISDIIPRELLAAKYNAGRKKRYQKSSVFLEDKDDIRIVKNRLYSIPSSSAGQVTNTLDEEPYFRGRLLLFDLIRVVSRKDWSLEDLTGWAWQYYEILKGLSYEQDGQRVLDGKYFDLTPFNIILDDQKEAKIFDQEWLHDGALPLGYVFFRGVNYSLGAISFFNIPDEEVPVDILELTCAVSRQILPLTDSLIDQYRELETRNLSGIGVGNYVPFLPAPIKLRREPNVERQLRQQEHRINNLQSTIDEMQNRLAQANHENFIKEAELEAFRHLENTNPPAFPEIDRVAGEMTRLADLIVGIQTNQSVPLAATSTSPNDENIRSLHRQISELERDLLWYRNTYEYRSFLGVIKQKIASKLGK